LVLLLMVVVHCLHLAAAPPTPYQRLLVLLLVRCLC
jgi:hypothetical protein